MSAQRVGVFSVLLSLATACTPAVNQNALAPQRGPKARIHASFTGGITNRNAQARFTVESDAFALVGHLGGDGIIRFLYPTRPTERGVVRKGQTYSTAQVYARNDAIPSLYQARLVQYRHLSARMDSYDGGGNGYFFVIASRYPLAFDEISVDDVFDEIEVPNYYDTNDPRLTIKALGDLVSRGRPYTLEFASSFGSVDHSNFVDYNADCRLLSMSGLGFASYALWTQPYYFAFASRPLRNALGCTNRYAYGPSNQYYYGYTPPTVTPTPPPPQTRGTIRPPWQRRITPGTRSRGRVTTRSYLPERVARRADENSRSYQPGARARSTWTDSERSRSADQPRSADRSRSADGNSSATTRSSPPTVRESPAARQADRHTERATSERGSSETTRQSSPSSKKDP